MNFNENVELYDFDYVVLRIVKILDLDEGKIEIERERYGSKVLIEKILEIHNHNKEFAMYLVGEVDMSYYSKFDNKLKKDKDLGLVAIKAGSKNFIHLDVSLQKNFIIAQEVIKSLVREGNNITIIENFIETHFSKNNIKLWKFYENYLSKVGAILSDDLMKNINLIYKKNNPLFQLLFSKKIITTDGKKISINETFINIFETSLEKFILTFKNFELKGEEEKNIFYKDFLIMISGLDSTKIDKEILFIIDSILDIYDKKLKKKKIKESLDKKDINLNEKNKINIEDDLKKTDINIKEEYEHIAEFEDKLDLYLPNCTYSQSGLGEGHININPNLSIKISTSEKDNFTSLALLNFVKFYNILYKLGLDFIWNSYKNEFKGLLISKNIGFDYLNGKGVDEEKVLEILNLIGKNIGLSDEQITTGDKNSGESFIPYKTIGNAYSNFRKAKLSSKINNEYIDTNIVIGTAEKKLSDDGKINYSNGTFDFTKWK